MPEYAPEIYGPLGKYLGHFQDKKILEAGHNITKEEEEILKAAEESAARLEAMGLGKEEPAPKPKPEVDVGPTGDADLIKQRIEMERKLGLGRGKTKGSY